MKKNNARMSKDADGNVTVVFKKGKRMLVIPASAIDDGTVSTFSRKPASSGEVADGVKPTRRTSQPPPPPPPTKRGYAVFKEGSKYPMSEEELVARERKYGQLREGNEKNIKPLPTKPRPAPPKAQPKTRGNK